MAQQVLGDDVHVVGMTGNAFSCVPGMGSHSDYEVRLEGSQGAKGTLAVEADTRPWPRPTITVDDPDRVRMAGAMTCCTIRLLAPATRRASSI